MNTNRSICSQLIRTPVLLLALASSASADTFTWGGGAGNWGDVNWLPGPVAGTVNPADFAIVTGGLVNFTQHDTFGNAATTTSPGITIDNTGTLVSNGWFTTMIGLGFTGGTLHANGGANAGFQAFQLKGTVTSSGASSITGTAAAFSGVHVTNNTFDVTSGTLAVSASLINAAGGAAAGFTKTGAGTMSLSGANGLTGGVVGAAGTLDIATGGSLTNIALLNTKSGGAVTISGTVTIGNAGSFGVGAGTTATTGSVTVNTGGVLNIGGGGGFTGVGGKDATGTGLGNGTLTIAGGTLNVAPVGTGTSGTPGASGTVGLDATRFWMNPYGTGGGTSTIHLNGGLLSTARAIQRGSTSNAIFNFNGGTLQTTAASPSVSILTSLTRANVRDGGAIVDTNGFDLLLNQPLLHSDIGGDAATDGGFTKTGAGTLSLVTNASTFTGNVLVSQGTLVAQGSSNTAGVTSTATALGNVATPGKTMTIANGATLRFNANDPIGSTTSKPAAIIVNGGTLSRGTFFATIGDLTLNSGATMTGGNGVNGSFQGWTLRGTVTAGGSGGSVINTTGATNTGIHLGVNGPNEFIVNSTGSAVDLAVNAPLIDRPANNVGAGVLLKTGTGTMSLGAANGYTGTTTVNGGTLLLDGSLPAGNAVIVGNGAGFGRTAAGPTTFATLTLGATAGDTSSLTFSAASTLVVGSAGGLVANGGADSVTVNVMGAAPTNGTYTLLDYNGALGGGYASFKLGSLPPRVLANLVDNAANTSIDLNVTGVDTARWSGAAGGSWTTTIQGAPKNWVLNSDGTTQTDYIEGDTVHFTDSATSGIVTIDDANVAPSAIVISNSTVAYAFGGSKAIVGGAALTKSGSAALALNSPNTYSGATTLAGGTTTAIAGALGSGAVTFTGGSFRYAAGNTTDLSARIANSTAEIALDTNGNDVTFASALGATNTGGLVKNGAGTLTLASTGSGYSGNIIINGGTIAATAGLLGANPTTSALGNPTIAGRTLTINSGARLELKQHDIIGNAASAANIAFIINGGTLAAVSGSQASGNGPFNILGPVTLSGGTLTSTGGANSSFQSLSLKGTVSVIGSSPSVINTTGLAALLNGTHLSQAGGNVFDVADVTGDPTVDLTVAAPLIGGTPGAGPNELIKIGAGTMSLNDTNSYAGMTTVNAGTLLVNGSISGAATVNIGGILGGTGTLGSTTVNPGGTLAPGTSIGILNFSSSLTLSGTSGFEISKTGISLASDMANVTSGTLTLGGSLHVTASGDPLAPGDTFNLFDAPTFAGTFAGYSLPGLTPGLSWNTDNVAVDGTLTVVPEPGTAFSLLGGLAMLLGVRRRRA